MRRVAIVIGGGVIGLSVAHRLSLDGLDVTVIDPDASGQKASTGNAGGIAVTEVVPASMPGLIWRVPGWLFDPLGPLSVRPAHAVRLLPWLMRFVRSGRASSIPHIAAALAALNSRATEDWETLLRDLGLEDDIHKSGALALYETGEAYRRDSFEWDLRRQFGIECHAIDGSEAKRMEPALGAKVDCAVWLPQWSYISDPMRVQKAFLSLLARRDAQMIRGTVERVESNGVQCTVTLGSGEILKSDVTVVAAGAWSAALCKQLGDPVFLESERGYNVTVADPGISLQREIIFAERKFVATPLSCGLRIGGAAEFAGLAAAPNLARAKILANLAQQYLPDLNLTRATPWMGHRPATPDSLPVISRSRYPNVFHAFGHGHLGLTQAPTTGRLIAALVSGQTPDIDLSPYRIDRFRSGGLFS